MAPYSASAPPLFAAQISTSSPLAVTPTWTDLVDATGRSLLISFRATRGRQHVLANFDAGRCSMEFFGMGRELDPTNTSSAFYPYIDADRMIRVGFYAQGLTYNAGNFIVGSGSWTPTNCSLTYGSTPVITSTANGTVSIVSERCRILGGRQYQLQESIASTTGAGLTWAATATVYDINLNVVGTYTTGPQTGTTVTYFTNFTTPASAFWVAYTLTITGTTAGNTVTLPAGGLAIFDVLLKTGTVTGPYGAGALPFGLTPLFTGYIDSISPKWATNLKTTVTITATDIVRLMQHTKLPVDFAQQAAINDGAVSFWPFDDPAGSTTVREMINGRSAIVSSSLTLGQAARNATTTKTTALIGTTFNNGLTAPQAAGVPASTYIAVEAWIKPSSSGTYDYIAIQPCAGTGSATVSFTFYVNGNSLTFGVSNGTTFRGPGLTSIGWTYGQWAYVIAYIDHNGFINIRAYQNGTWWSFVDNVVAPSVAAANGRLTIANPNGTDTMGIANLALYASNTSPATLWETWYTTHALRGTQLWVTPQTTGQRFSDVCSFVGVPSSLIYSSNDTGQSSMQSSTTPPSGTAKQYLDLIQQTEMGYIFADGAGKLRFYSRYHFNGAAASLTFGEKATEIGYKRQPDVGLDVIDLYTASTCTATGGNPQTWTNATQAAKYGINESIDQANIPTTGGDSEMLARAQANVARFSTASVRWRAFTVDLLASDLAYANGNGSWLDPLVEIGYVATLNRRPWDSVSKSFGAPLASSSAIIEGVEHDVVCASSWDVALHVAPNDTLTYWVLDSSALDSGTRLGW